MATAIQLVGTGIAMGFVHVLTGPDHMSVRQKKDCSARHPVYLSCVCFLLWMVSDFLFLLF